MYHVLIMNFAGVIVGFGKTAARNPAHAVTTVAQHKRLIDLPTAVQIQRDPQQWPAVMAEHRLTALVT